MKVAIIGGGITGLTAAYQLTKLGHAITIFERDPVLGGLASGFRPATRSPASPAGRLGEVWDWSLEKAYHHMFTNDHAILSLIRELGIGHKLIISRPITANYWKGQIHQFDSPLHLLTFSGLSFIDKIRTGMLVAFCKLWPFWQTLESITAKQFFIRWGGKKAWDVIWEPLMTGKFGHLDSTIAASWLWARIHKRTLNLCYIEGGFQTLVDALAAAIKKNGGVIKLQAEIPSIQYESGIMNHESWENQGKNPASPAGRHNSLFTIHNSKFDRVLLTTPTPIAAKLVPKLATHYSLFTPHSPLSIPHLHAQVLILETDKPILDSVYPDKIGVYWLSITDRSFPFLAVVAHTNFIDKIHYGGRHITYIGNYLPPDHPYLKMTKEQLLGKFLPFIKRITHNSRFMIHNSYLFTAPYAQPVHQVHYSKRAPKFETPVPGVYLANMDSIYPWDRGTNYAVELGQKAAHVIMKA